MKRYLMLFLFLFIASPARAEGPFPTFTGLSAGADDAIVAGSNPAAMTLFGERASRVELLAFASESTWRGQLGEDGPVRETDSSSSTAVPVGAMVMPIRDNLWFGFTVLGSGFSEEFDDDWAGRYLLQEYELRYISAYPSLATRLSERVSVGGSLALTYTTYEQRKAVPNLEPGLDDGSLQIDTDGLAVGFGLSLMVELSERTRLGFNYRSAIDPSLEGKAKFSDLGPLTEGILDNAGLIGAAVDVTSRQPQNFSFGGHFDFENDHTLTLDASWIDFSDAKLAEIYVNGEELLENLQEYQDAWAFSASYGWPISARTRLAVGGFWVNDIVGDENRTMALRLDDIWSVGLGVRWHWKDDRYVNASLNYMTIGNAPVRSPSLPGFGQVEGRYTSRDTLYLRLSMSFGGPER